MTDPSHAAVEAAMAIFNRTRDALTAPRDTTFNPDDAAWEALEPALSAAAEADPALGFTKSEIEALERAAWRSKLPINEAALHSARGKIQRSLEARRDG